MLLSCLGGRLERRKRLRKCNIDQTVELIRNAKKIIVLTGAGISVSCGIPDFRSRNGLYAKLAVDFPELPDPQVGIISFLLKQIIFILEYVLPSIFPRRSEAILQIRQRNISGKIQTFSVTQFYCQTRKRTKDNSTIFTKY